jgi:hypothetical protein
MLFTAGAKIGFLNRPNKSCTEEPHPDALLYGEFTVQIQK